MADFILILFVKVLSIIGFFYLMRLWIKKTKGNAPKFFTWILGLFFTLLQPFTIFEGIFRNLYELQIGIFASDLMRPENSGSLASILAIIFYVYMNKRIINSN